MSVYAENVHMLDQLKAAGAIAQLMKNKDMLKAGMERVKTRLKELRVQGGAGNGAVIAIVSGDGRLISVSIEPPAIAGLTADTASRLLVQDLIVQAVNNATDLARAAAQREIQKEAEAMGIPNMPGMSELMGSMGG